MNHITKSNPRQYKKIAEFSAISQLVKKSFAEICLCAALSARRRHVPKGLASRRGEQPPKAAEGELPLAAREAGLGRLASRKAGAQRLKGCRYLDTYDGILLFARTCVFDNPSVISLASCAKCHLPLQRRHFGGRSFSHSSNLTHNLRL